MAAGEVIHRLFPLVIHFVCQHAGPGLARTRHKESRHSRAVPPGAPHAATRTWGLLLGLSLELGEFGPSPERQLGLRRRVRRRRRGRPALG